MTVTLRQVFAVRYERSSFVLFARSLGWNAPRWPFVSGLLGLPGAKIRGHGSLAGYIGSLPWALPGSTFLVLKTENKN